MYTTLGAFFGADEMYTFYRELTIFWNIADAYFPMFTFWCWCNVNFLLQINLFSETLLTYTSLIHFLMLMKCDFYVYFDWNIT